MEKQEKDSSSKLQTSSIYSRLEGIVSRQCRVDTIEMKISGIHIGEYFKTIMVNFKIQFIQSSSQEKKTCFKLEQY